MQSDAVAEVLARVKPAVEVEVEVSFVARVGLSRLAGCGTTMVK